MRLAELQALFQRGVLAGDAEALAGLTQPSPRGAADAELFAVYAEGYRIRLAEFVAEDYPALRAYLGDDAFAALTEAFIAACPPRHRNARYYTPDLPRFLEETPRWGGDARALSLARFERALNDAFDAADAAPLALQALASFAPESWPRLAFGFHPSLRILELAAGALDAYEASLEEGAQSPPSGEGVETVAVWRCGEEQRYRALAPDEYLALNEARAGQAFGDICQMAAFQGGAALTPQRLAQFLTNWFEDGLVIAAASAS